ncbi:uncharacterized protein LOC111106971 [Crassostrea virginica]
MDENIRCFAVLFVSLVVYGYDGIYGEFSPLSKNYLTCLIDAATFHSDLQTSFCVGSNPDLNVWHQTQEECNKICTIKSQNVSCSDPDIGMARFQFDVNLPVNTYSFGKCKLCFNITQINITCMLNKTSMNSEPHSTENEEITTSKIIYESYSTQNVEVNTAEMKSEPYSTKNVEITTTEMKSEQHSTQNEETTTSKMIYKSHSSQTVEVNTAEMKSEPHSTKNEDITTSKVIYEPSLTQNVAKSSGDKVELIVAAGFSGAVFGSLVTLGIWFLQRKMSKDKLWKKRSTVQNPTYNDSSRSSNPQIEPAVSLGNQYFDIVPKNNQNYTQTEESAIYNHLNEKPENTEDTESPYDHAQYKQNQPDTILDSDYMHINKQ